MSRGRRVPDRTRLLLPVSHICLPSGELFAAVGTFGFAIVGMFHEVIIYAGFVCVRLLGFRLALFWVGLPDMRPDRM